MLSQHFNGSTTNKWQAIVWKGPTPQTPEYGQGCSFMNVFKNQNI